MVVQREFQYGKGAQIPIDLPPPIGDGRPLRLIYSTLLFSLSLSPMKPSLPRRALFVLDSPFAAGRQIPRTSLPRPATRHASSSSQSESHPPKRRWISLVAVTVAAGGIGAYIRSEQSRPSTLDPLSFTKYQLVSKEPVSSTGSIFTLKPAKPDGNGSRIYEEAWRMGVWSVLFKQPQLQIGRDYTPLPPTGDDDSLRFFIRRDPHGEVSRYLHGLSLGSAVELRGPQLEYKIPGSTQEVLFIAGGTGIAPALQASYSLLRRGNHPRIRILWANRRREDCVGGVNDTVAARKSWFSWIFRQTESAPVDQRKDTPSPVVRELESLRLQYPGQVTVDYFVDEENTFIGKRDIADFAPVPAGKRKLILVSGPEGFISYMAGPKVWAQGTELQGRLGGIIREVDLECSVWKL
jgi:homoaconitate hydratase